MSPNLSLGWSTCLLQTYRPLVLKTDLTFLCQLLNVPAWGNPISEKYILRPAQPRSCRSALSAPLPVGKGSNFRDLHLGEEEKYKTTQETIFYTSDSVKAEDHGAEGDSWRDVSVSLATRSVRDAWYLDIEPPKLECPDNRTVNSKDKLDYSSVIWREPIVTGMVRSAKHKIISLLSSDNSGFHPLLTSVPVVEFPMKIRIGTTDIKVSRMWLVRNVRIFLTKIRWGPGLCISDICFIIIDCFSTSQRTWVVTKQAVSSLWQF